MSVFALPPLLLLPANAFVFILPAIPARAVSWRLTAARSRTVLIIVACIPNMKRVPVLSCVNLDAVGVMKGSIST